MVLPALTESASAVDESSDPQKESAFFSGMFNRQPSTRFVPAAPAPVASAGSASNQWTWQPVEDTYSPFEESDDTDDDDDDFDVLEVPPISMRPRSIAFAKHPTIYDDPEIKQQYSGKLGDFENYLGAELVKQYKSAPTPEGMEHLMAHYDQLINDTVRYYGKRALPEPAVRGKVYNAFSDSLDKYDPSSGMQFHNYFKTFGQRDVRRWAEQNSNFRKVPTTRSDKIDRVRVVVEEFKIDNDRLPNAKELAQRSGIPIRTIVKMLPEVDAVGTSSKNLRQDYMVNEAALYQRAVVRVYDHLSGPEKDIYGDLFDTVLGRPETNMNMTQLAAKHGVSNSRISKYKTRFREMIGREINQLRTDL